MKKHTPLLYNLIFISDFLKFSVVAFRFAFGLFKVVFVFPGIQFSR